MCRIRDGVLLIHADAVGVVNEHSIASHPYSSSSSACGDTITRYDYFLAPCATCDRGAKTEYCYYNRRTCIRLSDTAVSIINTNKSLSHQRNYSLDSNCRPRYLQRLGHKKFAVICEDSSYQLFQYGLDPQLGDIVHGEDGAKEGILVQSGNHLYHVEVEPYYNDIILFDVYSGYLDNIYPDADCAYSFSLHPTFSPGFFFSCLTSTDDRLYFLYTVLDHLPVRISICNNPISSEGSTFGVVCNDSLTIYMKGNVEESHSLNFTSPITFFKYLDSSTLIVASETGNQHIVNVDTFMNTSGVDGVYTLQDSSTCTPSKLLTHRVYATVCTNGALYNVRLYNTTNGETLMSIVNLTERPLDLYLVFGPPIPSPTTTTPSTPTSGMTTSNNSTDGTPNQLPSTSAKPEKFTQTYKIVLTVCILLGVLALLALVVCCCCCCCWRKSSNRHKKALSHRSGTPTPNTSITNISTSSSQEDLP